MSDKSTPPKQLLHLVFGGELTSLDGIEFRDLKDLDIIGIYPNYAEAHAAWKAAAQRTVDNAMMRYFVVHMHRLLIPRPARLTPRRTETGENPGRPLPRRLRAPARAPRRFTAGGSRRAGANGLALS
jgi:hypothetical protein